MATRCEKYAKKQAEGIPFCAVHNESIVLALIPCSCCKVFSAGAMADVSGVQLLTTYFSPLLLLLPQLLITFCLPVLRRARPAPANRQEGQVFRQFPT
jgi:hypothetical protein